ncbi:UDP-3-O-[3-hydroxymyristoyl] N-acetylglucosamine deacetylase [Novipirellula aureliae]|uniref:UDP-3-O-acyl-N-acetylglucosamine deacetylase n=1 Tax=Novipirellula aureliae TaxID=2527966 RepID=A0A5C6EB19_9BACT|nr:UDP-3-O-acyl-N-acetylglucosamine deacetylase [Novipirellula aureliae]TWU45127.1 UDP-3-O-[3-hydroxymyristoyl] N-acetylglucosamine deacetylase [Novipirellula aureliae]
MEGLSSGQASSVSFSLENESLDDFRYEIRLGETDLLNERSKHNHHMDVVVLSEGRPSVTPSRNEHTIAVSCEVRGQGYWSGRDVCVMMNPAPAGTGICLIRTDLESAPRCQATVANRHDANLRTNLQNGEARFEMVEHLMAAFVGLEIDNCYVEIDAEELPGLDGSSAAYVESLRHAGLIIQSPAKRRLVVRERLYASAGTSWIEITPSPDGAVSYEYRLSFDDQTPIPPQSFSLRMSPHRFIREVAPARTFVTEEQAMTLRSQGIASHVTNQDLLIVGKNGPIENSYRYPEECARHKLLDLIGDLALTNVEVVGNIVSYRGGHSLNGRMAQQIADLAAAQIPLTVSADTLRKAA